MKYVHRELGEAAEASNPGTKGMRREIVVLLLGTAALFLAGYFAIGWAVELALPRISVERERAWFSNFKLGVTASTPTTETEIARFAYAQDILAKLAARPGVPALDYKLVFLADKQPNAVAFPGGTIGITRGMLELADDESSIAFVLAHELGHFAQRDHLRGIGRALGRGVVLALVFGDVGDMVSERAGALLDLAHSRHQESGADLFGLALVHGAYGKTEGTDKVFVWLEQRQRRPAWTYWTQTHPEPADRLERLREHAKTLGTTK
ncbi:MAG: M48 family metallopeptidase [Verrucomicrobiota bacterium]